MHTIIGFPNKICLSISKFLKHFAFYRLQIFLTLFAGAGTGAGAGAGAGAAKIEKSGARAGAGAAKMGGSDNTVKKF